MKTTRPFQFVLPILALSQSERAVVVFGASIPSGKLAEPKKGPQTRNSNLNSSISHRILSPPSWIRCSLCTLAALLLCARSAHGITIAGFSSPTNDRFANDPSFIMNSFDLSGVALASDSRWVTMVSENVFVSSQHFFPANGSTVTFHTTNDPNGPTVTRTIQSSQQITGGTLGNSSDIRIGVLNANVTPTVGRYSFATHNTTTAGTSGPVSDRFTSSPYNGANAYLFGRSPSDFTATIDVAVGRNILDRWFDSVTAAGTTDDAIGSTVDASGSPNFVSFEAALAGGDSGAPMFVDQGGVLTLVGLNWFIGTSGGNSINGQSYLGNYDAEIQSFIVANAIPEPSGFLLSIASLSLLLRRKR